MKDDLCLEVEPDLLRWAISRSGYREEELYRKIFNRFKTKYFTYDYFKEIIDGKRNPNLSDLKKIDSFLKRGIPFYFISFIPDEDVLAEFRKEKGISFPPETEIKLRNFNELREELKILLAEHGLKIEREIDVFNIDDDPLVVSEYMRKILEYKPVDWSDKSSKDVFNYLREKIEEIGPFVFKDELVKGMRGCVFLSGNLPPLILIKSSDDKNGEIFTLLHEFAHYLLRNEDILFIEEEDTRTERWCNEVTASFLMNINEEEREEILPGNRDDLLKKDRIMDISDRYKLSKNAIMLKYLHRNIISEETYGKFLDAFMKKNGKGTNGSGNYHYTNRDRLSRKFMSLVYNSYREGRISLHDTMEYFRIKDSGRLEQYLEVI